MLILLVAADQGAKWLSYLYLKGQPSVSLIPGVLELHYLYPENRELRLECFREVYSFCHCECTVSGSDPLCMDPYSERAVLSAVAHHCYSTCSWCTGKFYRSFFRGYVIDFIYFSLIDFPVFNLADVYVVVSGIFLILFVCTKYRDDDFAFLNIKQ